MSDQILESSAVVSNPVSRPIRIQFGDDFELDTRAFQLRSGGIPLKLKPIAMELLIFLVERRGEMVTREEIVARIWGEGVFLDTDNSINGAINKIRQALRDDAEGPRFIQTVTGRGYRFIAPVVELRPPVAPAVLAEGPPAGATDLRTELESQNRNIQSEPFSYPVATSGPFRLRFYKPTWVIATLVLAIVAALGIGAYRGRRHPDVTTNGREPLLVSEFTNATGDPVFDDTLREIAITELDRSPVFEVVNDKRVSELLRSVGQSPKAPLTSDLAQKICARAQVRLVAEGAIKPQGSGYLIELVMLDCPSERIRSHEQADSQNIDEVLKTLGGLAAATRLRLPGSSGAATTDVAALPTASVQALKVYITGLSILHSDPMQSATMLRRATTLDPNFAEAWLYLSIADQQLGERQRETEDLKRAFALRDRVPRELKQRIEGEYFYTTGEVYKAIDALRSWENLDSRQFPPHNLLGLTYAQIGEYEKSTQEFRLALAAAPSFSVAYENLAAVLQAAGRYEDAAAILRQAQDKGLFKGPGLHFIHYELALLRSDAPAQEEERIWMEQNTVDPLVVSIQANIDSFGGNLSRARRSTQHAVDMALESNLKESAATMLLRRANAESLLRESSEARTDLGAAIRLSDSKILQSRAARAMALNGQGEEALQIMNRLLRENPSDTMLRAVDAPLVLAASQLRSGQTDRALRTLEPIQPYEFGWGGAGLLPNYLRGLAYLKLHKAVDAAAEFKAVLDHRGVEPLAPAWEMSRLGLARAYALQGDTIQARTSYEDFFALWKNADSANPVLKEAKGEYARLN